MNDDVSTVITAIECEIQALREDASLVDEINFNARANAIDFIDFHIIDRIAGLFHHPAITNKLNNLQQDAETLKQRLEKIDRDLFKKLREEISNGNYSGTLFIKLIHSYLEDYFDSISCTDQEGYDNLDIFMNGLLCHQLIPEPTAEIKPDMVFYQKTPARIVFRMVELAGLKKEDVFFDIGSGLGQVAILVNLLSNCHVHGIEYDPAYCSYAELSAAQLNLSDVKFIHTDALKAGYSEATVFFLYTPLAGNSLQLLLRLLQKEAQKRLIRVFSYGPCSVIVARELWLICLDGNGSDHYKLYAFESLDVDVIEN